MNLFAEKKTTKTLILIILLVTIFTFITPNYCFAAKSTEEKWGGKLFRPIANFIAFIPDLVINLLQEFLWDGSNVESDGKIFIRTSSNIYKQNSSG